MTERPRVSRLLYPLAALCAGAIVAGVLLVGPASSSQVLVTRSARAARGVVQSTVSGSGNLQAASQLNLGFRTGGTVDRIYVSQGERVAQGQLLATLDPQSAEVTLEQARASLQSAAANLAHDQETGGESSTGATSNDSSAPGASTTTAALAAAKPAAASKLTTSAATRGASLASARALVKSDALSVHSDEQAVQNTRLYAPSSGTIVALSGQVGEVVSASGTTKASSTAGLASGSGSSAAATTGGSSAARSTAGSGDSPASSGSTGSTGSSSFAVLSDLSSMQVVVSLSESEIVKVKDGQIATVTVEALDGIKLAAHVSEVALLATSSSGVVSYDVTFQLDQLAAGLRIGMSATAEVIIKQAEGVEVPSSAISDASVTVLRDGKQVHRRVLTGLAGDSSTIVLSGLRAGETVVLATVSSTSSSPASLSSRVPGRTGGGLGAAGGGFPAGGGGVFLRGGG